MSMYAQFYSHMPWQELPIFALLLFLGVFVTVVLRYVVFMRASELEPLARLPLEPDDGAGRLSARARVVDERTPAP